MPGHELKQVFSPQPLALVGVAFSEQFPCGGQLDRASGQLGKPENVDRLGDRKKIIDLKGQCAGEVGDRNPSSVISGVLPPGRRT